MTRAGRPLELLVAILERACSPLGVSVESPAYVLGRKSGSLREVDVAISGRLGTADLLIIIECRDRTRVEDVRWIEELATKVRDVGAQKAIAVSSSGFSEGAAALAASEGVELRTMKALGVAEAFSWLGLTHLDVHAVRFGLGGISLQLLRPDEHLMAAFSGRDFASYDDKLFVDKNSGEPLTPNEILRREIPNAPALQVAVPADGSVVKSGVEIRFPANAIRYQVVNPCGPVDVHGIEFTVHLAAERRRVLVEELTRYTRDDSVVAETAEFRFSLEEETYVFSLHLLKEIEALAASLSLE